MAGWQYLPEQAGGEGPDPMTEFQPKPNFNEGN
jgi:hypothetical protein